MVGNRKAFWCFVLFVASLHEPPKINSNRIVTKFATITTGFRYCMANSKLTICDFNGLFAFMPDMSSRPYLDKNRCRFRIKRELASKSPT